MVIEIGGSCIGGNYYADSAGTGFSETCYDNDTDGFCDDNYDLYGITDYLALAAIPTEPDNVTPILQSLEIINVTNSSANVSWSSSEASNCSINYGTTSSLGTYVNVSSFSSSGMSSISSSVYMEFSSFKKST